LGFVVGDFLLLCVAQERHDVGALLGGNDRPLFDRLTTQLDDFGFRVVAQIFDLSPLGTSGGRASAVAASWCFAVAVAVAAARSPKPRPETTAPIPTNHFEAAMTILPNVFP